MSPAYSAAPAPCCSMTGPLTLRTRRRAGAIVMQDVEHQIFTDRVNAEIDLAGLADRHPLSLPGGRPQRLVVVAAARVSGRRSVGFDEPNSSVDRWQLTPISQQIRTVATDGAVVLLSSHGEDLISVAADRSLTLTWTYIAGHLATSDAHSTGSKPCS